MIKAFCTLEFEILKSHMEGNIRVIDEIRVIGIKCPGDEISDGITSRNLYLNNSLSNSTNYIVYLD